MNGFQNGTRKVAAWLAIIGSGCLVLTSAASYYAGWSRTVSEAVLERQMVNAHDEALKKLVPKVDEESTTLAVQQRDLTLEAADHERIWKAIEQQNEQINQTHDMIQMYLQGLMKEGKIPR